MSELKEMTLEEAKGGSFLAILKFMEAINLMDEDSYRYMVDKFNNLLLDIGDFMKNKNKALENGKRN